MFFGFSLEWSSFATQQPERSHSVSPGHGKLHLGAAIAPGLRGPSAQQTEAIPHHPAAVRLRHLPGDRRTCQEPRSGTSGKGAFIGPIRTKRTRKRSKNTRKRSTGLFTPSDSEKDQRINGKFRRKFSLSRLLLLGLNTVLHREYERES